jgi:hypothetical protein
MTSTACFLSCEEPRSKLMTLGIKGGLYIYIYWGNQWEVGVEEKGKGD